MEERKVSIVVPIYNAEKYITETVNSVLSQTYKDWELLLIEDCSTDQSRKVIQKFNDERIRVILQPENRGAAEARNRGIKEAVGRYLAFLDADDIWIPTKLSTLLQFMEEKQAAFVFSNYEFGDEFANPTGKIVKVPETINYKQALRNTTIFTSTVMFDRMKVSENLLSMPHIESEDTALWWKVLRNGYIAYGCRQNLVIYRRPQKSLSSNKISAVKRIWNLYRKAEHLNIFRSAYCFMGWGFRAVKRRI